MPPLFRLLPLLLAALAYWPVLHAGLVWDDPDLLRPEVLGALWEALPFNLDYFRPLGTATLALDARLWGGTARGFHIGNLLLHLLNTSLLMALLQRRNSRAIAALRSSLLRRESPERAAELQAKLRRLSRGHVALLLGCIYAVHPALVEGVAFIASRFDLLVTAFMLAALWADTALRGPARLVAVAAMFLAAALSKEMAVTFPVVLVLWHIAADRRAPLVDVVKRNTATYAAVGAAGLLYLGLRWSALGGLLHGAERASVDVGGPVQHLLLIAMSLATYFKLMLFPFDQLSPIHHTALPVPADSVQGWSAVVLVVALAVGAARTMRQRVPAAWLLAAAGVALLPVVHILPLDLTGGSYAAERFLTFPVALLVLAAATVDAWPRWGLGLWLVAGLVTTRLTVAHWQDEVALWSWGVTAAPDSALPRINLARILSDSGDPEQGLALSTEATQLDRWDPLGWNNKGQALFRLGRYDEAAAAFAQAVSIEPGRAMYHSNLGGALLSAGRLEEAQEVLEQGALPLAPRSYDANRNLGSVLLLRGRPDRAIPVLETALELASDEQRPRIEQQLAEAREPALWVQLADRMRMSGEPRQALDILQDAAQLGAAPLDVAVSASSAPGAMGELDQATATLLPHLPTTDPRPFFNLGVIAQLKGDFPAARTWLLQAAERDPAWALPRQRLAEIESVTEDP